MPTSSDSQQPLWRTLLIGAGATLVVGTVMTWLLHDEPEAKAVPEGMVVDEEGELVDARVRFEADREARRRAALPKTSAAMMLQTFEGGGPGAAPVSDLQAARDGFAAVVSEIETMAERPRAIRQRKWREVYRTANDAFSALSAQLDAKDPKQAKELEAAHKQLVTSLSIVRVRGGKFRIH